MEQTFTIEEIRRNIEGREKQLHEMDAKRDQFAKETDGLKLAVEVIQQDYGYSSDTRTVEGDIPAGIDDAGLSITRRVRNAVYETLKEKRPLYLAELLERIEERGVEIVGKNPIRLLSSYISPDDRLLSVKGLRGYWTLTEEPTGRRPLAQQGENEGVE